MIRRGFWLAAGAVTGIYGYRRASAIGRRLSASFKPSGLNPSGSAQGAPLARRESRASRESRESRAGRESRESRAGREGRESRRHRGAIGLARETFRFTRDVREGMELYTARHSAPAGSTLSTDHSTNHEPEDGH
jgi:hypothetical protein